MARGPVLLIQALVSDTPWWRPRLIPTQRPVTRSFDVFFDLRLNKRLSKQSWGWWFETPSFPLWRHSNDTRLPLRSHYVHASLLCWAMRKHSTDDKVRHVCFPHIAECEWSRIVFIKHDVIETGPLNPGNSVTFRESLVISTNNLMQFFVLLCFNISRKLTKHL